MIDITEEILDRVADAIEKARCPDREGPFGLYDYSNYRGNEEPHCVRDFRDPRSDTYGNIIFRSSDREEAERMYERLTRQHIAAAAIAAMNS